MPINSFLYPATQVASGYEVANSLRFDDGSTDYLNRTQSTSPTNSKKGTISFWVKRGALGDQHILNGYTDTNNRAFLNFTSDNRLQVGQKNSGTTVYQIEETPQRRDVSAWYHCVFAFDTTDGTASNRLKLYVNGSQVTDFTTNNEIEVNEDIKFFNLANLQLGRAGGGSNYFDGYLAEFVYVDGTQLDADQFGEFDSDTNIWKPINVSGLTFGNNGFYLDFENSGSLGADASGNGNNFTVNNLTSIDQSTDTCTNNFATMNPLNVPTSSAPTFSEGNLKSISINTGFGGSSTIGLTQGKWFLEAKSIEDSTIRNIIGISGEVSSNLARNNRSPSSSSATNSSIAYQGEEGRKYVNGTSTAGYGATYGNNDIIGMAIDLDSSTKTITFYKNGASQGAITIPTDVDSTTDGAYFICHGSGGASPSTFEFNFGSPPYSISSGNSDGNGYGNFEYSVPSGYYSICTKNLAEYG